MTSSERRVAETHKTAASCSCCIWSCLAGLFEAGHMQAGDMRSEGEHVWGGLGWIVNTQFMPARSS